MKIKFTQFVYSFKKDLWLIISIGFGVFLFVLFFQPFPLESFDFNNRLLLQAGLGTIVFLFLFLVRLFVEWFKQKYDQDTTESGLSSFMGGFLGLILSSVSFAFYLTYVGHVRISFYIMFKIVLVCLAPIIVLSLYDTFKALKEQNNELLQEKERFRAEVHKYEEDNQYQTIELMSENSAENLNLPIEAIAFVRSADNYVEIAYTESGMFRKKLLRNTLKHIEMQLHPWHEFIRCHRICIVNVKYIEKLNRNYSNYWLSIKGFDERIPVSIQHVFKLKELI